MSARAFAAGAMSVEQLEQLQLEKVRAQIEYCHRHSPYYRERLRAAGVEPGDIRTWEDFRTLPVLLTKDDERRTQERSLATDGHAFGEHLCCSPRDLRCVCSTSGTTGMPTFLLYTARDLAVTDETWFRLFEHVGLKRGDRVANLHGLSMTGLGLPLLHALRSYGAAVAPVGAEARSERILHYLELIRPRAVFGTPALMTYLVERSRDVIGKPVGDLGVDLIVCTGAPGAGLPEVRRRIQDEFGARLFDAAGGSQGIHNVSCEAEPCQGMHVLTPDLGIWSEDLVDPATRSPIRVSDGAIGEALLTALEQRARPALKFALGDLLQVSTRTCPCGRPGNRIRIVGRVDDMLIVLGVNLHPTAVWDVVLSWRPLTTGEMRIVLDRPGTSAEPPVRLRIEHGPEVAASELDGLAGRIAEQIHQRLRCSGSGSLDTGLTVMMPVGGAP